MSSCPTSKKEWDIAARKKNCSKIASHQKCSSVEKFQYHCVLNGYRNETLEVCAPSRVIFGISFIYSKFLCSFYVYLFTSMQFYSMFSSFKLSILRILCRVQSSWWSNSRSAFIPLQRHISQM